MDNIQQNFLEAGTLMLAGMVFVFAFLSILIVFINTVLAGLAKKFPDPIAKPSPRAKKNSKSVKHGDISPAIVAAISSSVKRYRAKHGQK